MPICPIFGLMSSICSDLPISAAICLCIDGQKLAQILSVYMKKIAGGRGSVSNPAGGAHDAPQIPKSDSQRLKSAALAPYSLCLWRSWIALPKLCSPGFFATFVDKLL